MTGMGSSPDDLSHLIFLKLFYRPSMVVRCSMPPTEVVDSQSIPRHTSSTRLSSASSPLRTISNLPKRPSAGSIGVENNDSKSEVYSTKSFENLLMPSKTRPGFTPLHLKLPSLNFNDVFEEQVGFTEWDSPKKERTAQNIVASFQAQIQQLLSPSLSSPMSVPFPNPQIASQSFGLNVHLSSPLDEIQFVLEEIPRYSSRKRHCVAILMLVLHLHLQSNAFLSSLKVLQMMITSNFADSDSTV